MGESVERNIKAEGILEIYPVLLSKVNEFAERCNIQL
jgi:hypothetical protein